MSSAPAPGQAPYLVIMLPWLLFTASIAGAIPAKISTALDEHGLESLGSSGGSSFAIEQESFRNGRFLRPSRLTNKYFNGISARDKQQVDDYELNEIGDTDKAEFRNENNSIRERVVLTKTEYNKLMKKFDYGKIPKKGITYQYKPSSYLDLPRSFIRFDEILATKDTDKFILLDEDPDSEHEGSPTESPPVAYLEDSLRDLIVHLLEPNLFLKVPASAWIPGQNPRSSIKFSEVEVLDGERHPGNARVLSLSVLDPVLSQIEVFGGPNSRSVFDSPLSPETRISLDQVPIKRILDEATSSQHLARTKELPAEVKTDDVNPEAVLFEDKHSRSASLDSSGRKIDLPVVTEETVIPLTHEYNSSLEKNVMSDLAESDKEKDVSTSGMTDPYAHYEEQDHLLLNISKADKPSDGEPLFVYSKHDEVNSVSIDQSPPPERFDGLRNEVNKQEQTSDEMSVNQPQTRPRRALNLFRFSGESGRKYLEGLPVGPLPPPSNYTPTYGIRNATIDPERKRQRFNHLVMNMDVSSDYLMTPFLIPAAKSSDSLANLMEYTMPTLPPLIAPSDLPMLFTIPPVEEWFPAINTSAPPFNWTLPKAAKMTSLPGLNLTSLPGLDLSSLSMLNLSSLPGLDLSSLPGLNLSSLPGLSLSSLPGLNLSSLPGLNLSLLPTLNVSSLRGLNFGSPSGLNLSSLPGLNITSLPSLNLTYFGDTDNPIISGLSNIDNLFASSVDVQNSMLDTPDVFADLRNKLLSLGTPSILNVSASDLSNIPVMDLVDANKNIFFQNLSINHQTLLNTSSDNQLTSSMGNIASVFGPSTQPGPTTFLNALDPELPTSSSGLRNVFGISNPSLFNIKPSIIDSIPPNVNISSLFSLAGAFSPMNALNNETPTVSNVISSLFQEMNPAMKGKLQNLFNSSTTTDESSIFSLISRAVGNATAMPENITDIFNFFTQTAEMTTSNPIIFSNIFVQNATPETVTFSDVFNITPLSEITTPSPFNLSNIFLQSTQESTTIPNIFGFSVQPSSTSTPNPWSLTNVFSVVQETTEPNPWNLFTLSMEKKHPKPWNISNWIPAKGEEATVTTSRGFASLFSPITETTTPSAWNFNNLFSQTTEATPQNPWNQFTFPQSIETTAASNPFNLFEETTRSPINAFNLLNSPPEVSTRSSLDLQNAFYRPTETATQNPWNLFNAFTQTTEETTSNPFNFLNLFKVKQLAPTPRPLLPSNFVGIGGMSNQNMANNIDEITEFFRRSGMAVNKGNFAVNEINSNPLLIPRSYLPPPHSEIAAQDNLISSASFAPTPFVTNIRQATNPNKISHEGTVNERPASSVSDYSNIMPIVSSIMGNPSHLPNVPNYIQGLSLDTILAMVPNLNPNLIPSFLPLIKNNLNTTSLPATPIPLFTGLRDTDENSAVNNANEMSSSSNDEPNSLTTFEQSFLNLFAPNKSASEDSAVTSDFITPPPLFPSLGNNRRSDTSSWTPLLGPDSNKEDATFKHNANDPLTIEPAKPVLVFSLNDDEAPPASKSAVTVNFNKIWRNEPGKLITSSGLSLPQFRNPFGRSLEEIAHTGTNLWTPSQGPLPNIPQEMIENLIATSGVSNDLLENVFRAMRSADFTDSSSNTSTSNNSVFPTLPTFVFPTFPPIEIAPPTTGQPSLFRYDQTTTTTTPPPFTLFPPLFFPTTSAPPTQNKSTDDDFTRFLQDQATKMSQFFEQMSDFSVEAVTHLKDAGTVVDSLGSAASRTIHALVDIAQVLEPVTNMISRKIQMVDTERTKSQQQQPSQQQGSSLYVRNVIQ